MEINKQHETSALSSGVLAGCLGVLGGLVGSIGFVKFIDAISTAHFGTILQGILLNPLGSLSAVGLVALGGALIAKSISTVVKKKREINKRHNTDQKVKTNSREKLVEPVTIEHNMEKSNTKSKTNEDLTK